MFDKKKVKLGIAPIGWTNDDMPDLGKENTFEDVYKRQFHGTASGRCGIERSACYGM